MFKKHIKIPPPFQTYKVTIKSLNLSSPVRALAYLIRDYGESMIVVNKQRARSITITLRCSNNIYQEMKLRFVKDMGYDFIWKD